MNQENIHGIKLVYPESESVDAAVVKSAIQPCVAACREHWGLSTPQAVSVIVMTDWRIFLDTAAPAHWKTLIWLSNRFQAARFDQIWQVAGGWNQSFGKRVAAGVKPARLIASADRRIGEKIFVPEADLSEKVFLVTCHELTHAMSDYLQLPAWLHEGLAMRTADICFDKQTVQEETLTRLRESSFGRITRYQLNDEEALIQLYVRAYWLVRWLESQHLPTLKSWLNRPIKPIALETQLAQTLNLPQPQLWERMDAFLWEKCRDL